MDTYTKIRSELVQSTLKNAKKQRLISVLDGINVFIDTADQAYVDQQDLAAVCGCGLSQIKKATRELEELGYLERIRMKRSSDKRYHWNTYRLIFPPVNEGRGS